MKRAIVLLCLLSLALSFAACGDQFTVEEAVAAFDEEAYLVQAYDEAMVDSIRQKMEIEGDILSITHVINPQTTAPNLEWTYIYEFSDEQDAIWFEENRSTFVSSQEGGRCVRFGAIVVYGTSPVIDTMEK